MSNLKDKAAAVTSVARTFQAVIDIGVELERLGDLEEAEAAYKQKIVKAKADADAYHNTLDLLSKQYASAKADVENARNEGDKILKEAHAQHASVVTEAHAKAEEIANQHLANVSVITDKAYAAQATLDATNKLVTAKQKELEELNGKISKVKADLRALAS